MGLFDHLFKSKSPPGEEHDIETAAKGAEPANPAGLRITPRPPRADPSAFLHPKDSVRPSTIIPASISTATSSARHGDRKPGAASPSAPPREIVLTLGDVLSRIPSAYLKPGHHDPKRELHFKIDDLSSDIARGRAAVPLSRIAQLVPDIFKKSVSRDDDTAIRLPLQKLVEQIGLLRSHPGSHAGDRTSRTGSLSEPPTEFPALQSDQAPPAVPPVEAPSKIFSIAPSAPAGTIELKPVAEPLPSAAAPLKDVVPAPPAPGLEATTPPPMVLAPASPSEPAETPSQPPMSPAALEGIAPPEDVFEPLQPPMSIEAEASTNAPFVLPKDAPSPESAEAAPAPVGMDEPAPIEIDAIEADAGEEQIQLSLAAILQNCPREIVVGEIPYVPDHVRITLPFAPIDRQLVRGYVEISAPRFVSALPERYQPFFEPKVGVSVPIPLEEVFQNLPTAESEPSTFSAPERLHVLPPGSISPQTPTAISLPPVIPFAAPPASEPVGIEIAFPSVEESPVTDEEGPGQEPAPVLDVIEGEMPAEPWSPEDDAPDVLAFDEPPAMNQPALPADSNPAPWSTGEVPIVAAEQPSAEPLEKIAEPPPLPVPAASIPEQMPTPNEPLVESFTTPAPVEATSNAPSAESDAPMFETQALESHLPTALTTDEAAPSSPEAPNIPPSSSVSSSEGTHTILPPQLFRPVIVLPPPIFGYAAPAAEIPEPQVEQEAPAASEVPGENVAPQAMPSAELELIAPIENEAEAVAVMPEGDEPALNDPPAATLQGDPAFVEVAPPEIVETKTIRHLVIEATAALPSIVAEERPFPGALHGDKPDPEFVPTWRATPTVPSEGEAATQSESSTHAPGLLLHLPKLTLEPEADEVLPPPALPLRRFDQDALQALFMTDETLDLAKISRLAAQLPGVHACVIATRDQACTGGALPEGFDLAALLGLAPRVGEAAGRLPIGALKHFTLYGERYSVSFFERSGFSLCAVHRPRSFVPGVREKLVAIADELSKP